MYSIVHILVFGSLVLGSYIFLKFYILYIFTYFYIFQIASIHDIQRANWILEISVTEKKLTCRKHN